MKPSLLKLLSPILLGTLLLSGCAQKDSPVGSNLAPGLGPVVPTEVLLSPTDVRFFRTSTTTGASTLLYMGYYQGYYSNVLVKFFPVGSILPDSFTVDSLRVKMFIDSLAVTATSPMVASAFLVNRQTWTEIGVTWETFDRDTVQMGASIATLQILPTAVNGDSIMFTLPAPDSLLRAWVAADSGDTAVNFNSGIYLAAATDQDYLLRFGSAENFTYALRPLLEMYLKDYDTTVTHGGDPVDTIFYSSPVGDAFLAKDSTTLSAADSQFVWIGNAAAYRTMMRFNIDSAFTAHYGVAVQRAELIVHFDSTNALNFDRILGAYGLPMSDTTWLVDPAAAPTTAVSLPGLSPYNSTLALNVTALVNDWIAHPGTHYGVQIHSANEYYNIARQAFYGPFSLVDPLLKPVLRIVYIQGGSQ